MNWLRRLGIFLIFLFLLLALLIKPIDRTPLKEQSFYQRMFQRLDTTSVTVWPLADTLQAGWQRINITPDYSMPMAGYKPRDSFEAVHDSIYCSILHLQQGEHHLYLISADLILFPPALRDMLDSAVFSSDRDLAYYSATHTHSSIGGWDASLAGSLSMGEYSSRWVREISDKIKAAIPELISSSVPARLEYLESDASAYVENRLAKNAPVDGKLRAIKVIREARDSALVYTYSGHATLVNSKSRSLSADYPGAVNQQLHKAGYAFEMYMAGMVGSHRITGVEGESFDKVEHTGSILSKKLLFPDTIYSLKPDRIAYLSVPLELGAAQLRINRQLALRNWVYQQTFGGFEGHLTAISLGKLLLISTPCDFSGELYVNTSMDSWWPEGPAMITSFNGDYIGYITEDDHYDQENNPEVRTMNWVGPYFGAYFEEVIHQLMVRLE